MSKEKQIEIKVVTYKEERLNYFTAFYEKAKKKFDRLFEKHKDAPYLSDEFRKMSDAGRGAEFLGDVVKMLKQSEWISVEERLPDNHRRVLVACEGTTIGGAAPIAIGSYGGGFWSLADADGIAYLTKYMHVVVTHWMPLPEAPKGGAE